jgi:hypothetical protein
VVDKVDKGGPDTGGPSESVLDSEVLVIGQNVDEVGAIAREKSGKRICGRAVKPQLAPRPYNSATPLQRYRIKQLATARSGSTAIDAKQCPETVFTKRRPTVPLWTIYHPVAAFEAEHKQV